MVGAIIAAVCDREFVIAVQQETVNVRHISERPDLIPQFKQAIQDWYRLNRPKSLVNRRRHLFDGLLVNRVHAMGWLSYNRIASSAVLIRARIQILLAMNADDATQTELAAGAQAIGAFGEKSALPVVRDVCNYFQTQWEKTGKTMDDADMQRLFDVYAALASLSESGDAFRELGQIYADRKPNMNQHEWSVYFSGV